MSEKMIGRKHRLSSFQIIILGFAGIILLGALILMLPISTTAGCVTPFNESLFTATSAVRNGACGAGYRQLLVSLWSDGDSDADSNRWTWCCHRGNILCTDVRSKNISNAAQYHAKFHLSTESRRYCPIDTVHPAGNISHRTNRCPGHAAGILPRLWLARDLAGGISLHICLL